MVNSSRTLCDPRLFHLSNPFFSFAISIHLKLKLMDGIVKWSKIKFLDLKISKEEANMTFT